MRPGSADPQQRAVYDAEDDALPSEVNEFDRISEFVRYIRMACKVARIERPKIVFMKATDWPYGAAMANDRSMNHKRNILYFSTNRKSWNRFIVVHEVAHLSAGGNHGHGPWFAGRMVELVYELIGPGYALDLVRSYQKHGVSFRLSYGW